MHACMRAWVGHPPVNCKLLPIQSSCKNSSTNFRLFFRMIFLYWNCPDVRFRQWKQSWVGQKLFNFSAFILIIFQFYFKQLLLFLLMLFKWTRQLHLHFIGQLCGCGVLFLKFPRQYRPSVAGRRQKDTTLSHFSFPPLIFILSILTPSWILRLVFWVSSECWMTPAQHWHSVLGL